MPYESVAQLEQRLIATKRKMIATKRELDKVSENMEKLKKRERIEKLLKAGRIIEDAGLLDLYNPNDLYLVLVLNKDLICHKRSLGDEYKQGFDFKLD